MRNRILALGVVLVCVLAGPAAEQPAPVTAKDLFYYLTHTIAWYQHLIAIDEGSATAENLLLRNDARELAKRVLQMSFVYARAQAAQLSTVNSMAALDGSLNASQTLQGALSKAVARVARLQDRLDGLDIRIGKASGKERDELTAERSAIAADLALAKDMQTALKNMTSFSTPKGGAAHGLLDQINDLEAVNPIAQAPNEQQKGQAGQELAGAAAFRPENSGVFTLVSKAFAFAGARKRVDMTRDETGQLLASVNRLRAPLRTSVRAIAAESDRVSSSEDQAVAGAEWKETGKQIAALNVQFKQLSTVMVPLSETAATLQSTQGALDDWRSRLDEEYRSAVRYLAVRCGILAGAVLLILLASEIWQRAIFRYVREPRRRRQFLLAKRLVVGLAMGLLLTLGLFSSFGSVATLLGFITAGLALALQNVVLSIVAYFFLVGRYGLRAGDRVTVQGVTGQVIEVGLVRLFLMELAGSDADLHPTGRLAVFANSVIFQPAALMKQAPGVDYTWHAVSATLEDSPDVQSPSTAAARERLSAAVESVYESYKQTITEQHIAFERSTGMQTVAPAPVSRSHLSTKGLEITIRYPVSLAQTGDIDERIVTRLLAEAEKEPKLRFASGGSPKVEQAV